MTQLSNDERDYENETAMKIDETMVNLRQSTFEPDAEFIMTSSRSDDEIKRRKKRQAEEAPNEEPEDNPNAPNEPTISESITPSIDDQPDEEPSVNLEVETSITKGPTTTFIGNVPLSLITRPNTTTTTKTSALPTTTSPSGINARGGRVTYYTKKPIIFPSETTTKFTVGPLVRQQSTGLTFASQKAKLAAPTKKNMKLVSTTRKIEAKKVQKKIEGTKKFTTKLMTMTTMKAMKVTNSTMKTTKKTVATRKFK